MKRREFFKKAAVVAGVVTIGNKKVEANVTRQPIDNQNIAKVSFPEKKPLIMYSDRPLLLDEDKLGNFAYRAYRYSFKPSKQGKITILSRATNKIGIRQPFAKNIKWNH